MQPHPEERLERVVLVRVHRDGARLLLRQQAQQEGRARLEGARVVRGPESMQDSVSGRRDRAGGCALRPCSPEVDVLGGELGPRQHRVLAPHVPAAGQRTIICYTNGKV